jgi:hypothetical protein
LSSIDPFHGFAQTKFKLEELNISLNNHYPQRIAWKILAIYDILDEALENHKKKVNLFYLRRANER